MSASGSMYPHPEAGNELDMDLSEDDAQEVAASCEAEGGSMEEDRSEGLMGGILVHQECHRLPVPSVWET